MWVMLMSEEAKLEKIERLKELLLQRIDESKIFGLSSAQKRFLYVSKMDEHLAAYNLPVGLKYSGDLNVSIFKESIQDIVSRHEILSTRFFQDEIGYKQITKHDLPLDYEYSDLYSEREMSPIQEDIDHWISDQIEIPFSFDRDSFIRFRLLRTGERKYLFLLNVHHIIWDDRSLHIFLTELSHTYENKLRDRNFSMGKPNEQYYDYVQWELEWQSSEGFKQQLDYWKNELGESSHFINLPLDRPRPAITNYMAKKKFAFQVDGATLNEIDRVCSREGIGTLMYLTGCFGLLLHVYTNQNEILIGMPASKRSKQEFEGVIGVFVNTLVIKANINKVKTLREFFGKTKDTMLEALKNKMLPFESVVEAIAPMRSQNVNPVVQVMIAYYMHSNQNYRLEGVGSEFTFVPHTISNFDITQTFHRSENSLSGLIEYNSDLLDENTVREFADLFISIMRLASQFDFDTKLSAFYRAILNPELSHLDVERGNSLGNKQVLVNLELLCLADGEKTALLDDQESISYRELDERSNQLANYLINIGAGIESRIAISMARSIDLVVAILGILKSGACFIPIPQDIPAERKQRIINNGKPLLLLHNGDIEVGLDNVEYLNIGTLDIGTSNFLPLRIERPLNSLVYIIYTSGSTGEPKGVGVSAAGLLSLVEWHCEAFGVDESAHATFSSSIGFDAFIWEIFPYLSRGAELRIVCDRLKTDVLRYAKWLEDQNITHTYLPTVILERMLSLTNGRLYLPNIVLTGGDKLNDWVSRYINKGIGQIYNAYGLTETSVVTTCGLIESDRLKITVGKAIPGSRLYILDDVLNCKPNGIYGQIVIGGGHLAREYISDPRLTAEKFLPNPYSGLEGDRMLLTGDEGRKDDVDAVEFVGRMDSQVSVGGIRVELMEIENAISESHAVSACAVLAISKFGTTQLVAYIVSIEEGYNDAGKLRQSLSGILPKYMIPHAFVFLQEFPITANGKLDRAKITAMFVENCCESNEPATDMERKIKAIWSDVLQRDNSLGLRQNIFEVGGNSLHVVEIANEIFAKLGVRCKVSDIFDNSTISELARFVERNEEPESCSLIESCNRAQRIPLSYTQERLWILDKLANGLNTYRIPICVHIKGDINEKILIQSLDYVLGGHEIFRTAFPQDEQGPYQLIKGKNHIDFKIVDLENIGVTLKEWHESNKDSTIFLKNYDVAQGEQIEIVFIKAGGSESILSVNIHHIITDGWSMNAFISMVFQAYNELLAGRTLEQNMPLLQYADYAFWQRNSKDAIKTQDEEYWRQSLQGQDRYIPFPLKRRLSASLAKKEVCSLGKSTSDRLDTLCRKESITPFMYFLATLSVLLYHYSKRENMLIYSISANRDHPQLKDILGPFINTLCFHLKPKPNLSFGDYLKDVKALCLGGFQRQSVPYEILKGAVQGEDALDGVCGIDVMFVMQNFSQISHDIAGLEFTELETLAEGVKHDLDIEVSRGVVGYSIKLTYNSGKLEALFARKLLSHFEELLNASFDGLTEKIGALHPVFSEERECVSNWNRIEPTPDSEFDTIVDLINNRGIRYADKRILIQNDNALSYGSFLAKANQLANYFSSIGIKPGMRIGVSLDRSFDSIVSILAIFKIGAAYVPLDPSYPASRIDYIVSDAKLAYLIVGNNSNAGLRCQDIVVLNLSEISQEIDKCAVDFLCRSISPRQTAYVIYTSGSTGVPTGVSISHGALLNHILWMISTYAIEDGEVACHKTSINFVDSVAEMWAPIVQGIPLLMLDHESVVDLTRFVSLLARHHVSRLVMVPSLLHTLIESFEDIHGRLPKLKTVMCGGEEISPQLARLFFHRLPNTALVNIYGASEVASDVTSYNVTELKNLLLDFEEIRTIPIGKAIRNCSVKVLDRNLNLCPIGVEGILYAGGEPATNSYFGRPSLTASLFIPDPDAEKPGARMYCLGDIGRLTESGTIEYLGRKDHQVKLNGIRVNLLEIANHVTELSFVEKVEVLINTTEQNGNYNRIEIICYLILHDQYIQKVEIDSHIRSHLALHLPRNMIPNEFNVVNEFPTLPNGKIDKKKLLEFRAKKESRSAVSPRNKYDRELVRIWLQLTEQDSISIDDRLFDAGGNSLTLIRFHAILVADSNDRFDGRFIDFKVSDFFKLLTIRRISDYVQGRDQVSVVSDSIKSAMEEKRRRVRNRQSHRKHRG